VMQKKVFGNEKNKLVMQPLGILVIEFLMNKFASFFDYGYTKEMEDQLDTIAQGKIEWHTLCAHGHRELSDMVKQQVQKFRVTIDDEHTLLIGKHGPVVKRTVNKTTTFLPVKPDIDLVKIQQQTHVTLEEVLDGKQKGKGKGTKEDEEEEEDKDNKPIGKYQGVDLYVKKGKYGPYAKWGSNTKSLKGDHFFVENIPYIEVIKYLDKDILDPSNPVGQIRELNAHISIRTGKYGDYVFYKKPRMKKPQFFKLQGFTEDYKKCDKQVLLAWIKEVHKVE
jgi:DNA topoisomerase-1